ncbi:MAG: hypothetical protein QXO40_00015 [Candidatus Aenigmatarchaeota archaeon]
MSDELIYLIIFLGICLGLAIFVFLSQRNLNKSFRNTMDDFTSFWIKKANEYDKQNKEQEKALERQDKRIDTLEMEIKKIKNTIKVLERNLGKVTKNILSIKENLKKKDK